ncbi:hypothetical protein HZA57_09445 [Candidatus Poribacteria bacterium]|nr:hypothetical protein [Candidatus Poribacteria bacterium]
MAPTLLYTATVPAQPEAHVVLDGLCETFIQARPGLPSVLARMLRFSVSERFREITAVRPDSGRLSLVRISFYRLDAPPPDDVALEIQDSGAGFSIGGVLPPYRKHQIGCEYRVAERCGQETRARIHSAYTASFHAEMNGSDSFEKVRRLILEQMGGRDFGLQALTNCWRRVEANHQPDRGTTLFLCEPRLLAG